MNMIICAIAFALFSIAPLSAQTTAQYANLLREVDELVTFRDTDLAAEYLIEKKDPGGALTTTRATVFRRDRTDQFLILILEPAIDKGKGYLKIGDNLWLYDPVDRSFSFTSAKERFQNSSARNSDFNRSNYSEDYKPIAGKKERLGKFDCVVLDLEATTDRVSFPKIRLWISQDKLVRKIEDYSLSGQIMRTTAVPTYQRVRERWIPYAMVIQDHLQFKTIKGKTEYERTSVTISKPSLKPLPDSVYTKEYLERVAK